MSLRNDVKKLRKLAERRGEGQTEALLRRMELRAEAHYTERLNEAQQRAHKAIRAAGGAGKPPVRQEPSEEARRFAETDTPEQAAADQRQFDQLAKAGAVTGLRAMEGRTFPPVEDVIMGPHR